MLYLLFSLSGFAGLIYESIWSHYIKLILGHAAYAQSLVLTIFMGGMALGAWLISLISSRVRNPLVWYAIIEGVIGIFGLAFHYEFLFFQEVLFNHILPMTSAPIPAFMMKWGIATMLLLPQAVLLGTTFPLMSAGAIRYDPQHSGHTLGMLYFTNSLGAAIGVLCSAFILIQNVGLPGTSLTAGIINISLALCVWFVAKGRSSSESMIDSTRQVLPITKGRILIVVAALTGATSFFYEIGWIRMLSLVLGSSVEAFELMLSAFIFGLAFGGYFIRRKADDLAEPCIYLAWVQVIMGLLATATLPLYTRSFSAMSFLINGLSRTDIGYVLFNINSHLIALCIMIPATFMAGMTLPLLTNILLKSGGGEAAIGRIYAANTFGAIVGILSAVNLVMPCFGTKGLLVSGGFVDVGVGAFLLIAFGRISSRLIKYSIPLTAVAASMVFFSLTTFDQAVLSSGVYRLGKPSLPAGARPLYYRDGKTATIALIRHPQGQMSIRTNGKTDALIAPLEMPYGADEITMVMAAVVPLALNPAARNVANIGLGSGLTTHTLLATDSIKIVDTIEIESCMVEGAHGFGKRVARAFYDPRSVIHIDDAKSFFSTHQKHYDIIVSEPSNPWVSGVGSLFSYEFYHYIQSYLNEGGIFVQWLQLYEINLGDVASVIKALDRAFAYYRVYNTDNANILILASKDNQLNTVNTWVFDHPKLSSELSRVAIQGPEDLSIRYLGDKHLIAPFFESLNSPLNSDYFPSLSYNAPKSRFKQDDASDLSWLHIAGVPILSWLNGIEPQGKISREGKYFDFYDRQIDAQLVVGNDVAGLEDQKLRFSAEFVNSALTFCRKPPLSDEVIIDILYTIAAAINPYLSKQQLNQYWMGLIDQYVTEDTNGKIEQWLRFHHAISQRQAALTIEYANRILSTEEELTENLVQYLVTAMLTAAISENRYDVAWHIVKRFKLEQGLVSRPFELRFLYALAAQGIAEQAKNNQRPSQSVRQITP